MKTFRILKSLLFLTGCCLLLSSCGKKTGDKEADGSPASMEGTGGGFSQTMGEGGQIGEALPLTGKALGGLTVVGEEDAVYCNLPENVRDWDDVVPLCVDPLYGILYYVDYGGDYMIHAIYNGESQTVVELPGKRLFCRGGKLYFLLEAYNRFKFEGAKSGNIAEYDPVTGAVKILSEESFSSIVVYQDVIYCQYKKGTTSIRDNVFVDELDYWFYLFDKNEFVAATETASEYAMDFRRYGEYFLAATLQEDEEDPRYDIQVGMELRKWDGERGAVCDGLASMVMNDYYVKDGKFHWLDSKGFHIWEPVSGEDQVYPWKTEHLAYCILVGDLFFSTDFRLMDIEKGSEETWKIVDSPIKVLHAVYTDGSQIYAIGGGYGSEVDQNSFLRRVVLTQVGEDHYEASFEALQE